MRLSIALAASLLLAIPPAVADTVDVPLTLTHEGRLLDNNDQPVSGTLSMTFRLYRAATGGTAVWSDTRTVSFDAGAYAVVLGDPNEEPANPLTADAFDGPVFLGVQVADGTELSPRMQVSSVPFAVRADLANRIDGGTISNATITNSDVDAAELKVNGTPVIDASGHFVGPTDGLTVPNAQTLGGVAASDYLTRADAQAGYVSTSTFETTNFSNLVVNGSFELGSTGALPQGWSALGNGTGKRAIDSADGAMHGQNALRIDDGENQATNAVEQQVIANGDGAAVRGRTFTAAIQAKRLVGTTTGRICLVDSDGGDPSATTCADLTGATTFARATVSHAMSANATYLKLVLDTGHSDADANDYVFDDATVVEGPVAPDYAPNVTEQLYDGGIPASKLAGDIPSSMITGSIPSSQISGSIPSSQISGSIPTTQLSGKVTSAQIAGGTGSGLDADSIDGLDSSKFMRADGNTATTGDINLDDGKAIRQNGRWTIGGDASVLSIGSAGGAGSGRDVEIDVGDRTALTAKMSGNVGIGTKTPNYLLEVASNTSIGGGALVAGAGNEIWTQPQTDNDSATLYVNHRGFADGQTRYRNFVVRDGKGHDVLAVTGSNATTTLSGPLHVTGAITANGSDLGLAYGRFETTRNATQLNQDMYIPLTLSPVNSGGLTLSNNQITVANAGYYRVDAHLSFDLVDNNRTVTWMYLSINDNRTSGPGLGEIYTYYTGNDSREDTGYIADGTIVQLNAGDKIGAWVALNNYPQLTLYYGRITIQQLP